MKRTMLAITIALMLFAQLFPAAQTIGAVTGPRSVADITITNVQVPAPPLFKGANISITATVKNLGTQNATNITVHFEAWNNTLSAPIDIGNDTSLGHDHGGANLTSGSSAPLTAHWNTSKPGKGVTVGLIYSINVTAKNATDGNPANNIMRVNVTFLDEPYLIVAEATPTATSVEVGAPFNITYKVQNIGTKTQDALGDNLQLYMDKDAMPLESVAIQGLAPKKVAQGMFILDTEGYTPGNHSFRLQLLYAARNATVGNISFLAPNPFISKLEWWPLAGKVGDTITVNATISNNGTSGANGLAVQFYVDPPYALSDLTDVVDVPAGGQNVSRFVWDTTGHAPGNHTVKVSLKPAWPSENITGNITLEVGGMADLAVTSLTLTPTTGHIGETINISVAVKNKGTWPSVPTNVSITAIKGIESKELSLVPLKALQPGEPTSVYYLWDTTGLEPWTYNIWARVDPESEQPDQNPANNRGNFTIVLTAKPDLTVSGLNMTMDGKAVTSVHKGGIVTINVVVRNIGATVSNPTRVALFLDGTATAFASMKLLGLTAGGMQTMPFTWDTAAASVGNHSFRAVVDQDGNNTEMNETNNVLTMNVTVLAPKGAVDMVVVSVSVNPKSPFVGDHVEITATIKNNGTANAVNVTLLFSYIIQGGNIAIYSEVVHSVLAGDQATVNAVWTTGNLASGNYVLNITIDPLNQLHEAVRSNNFRTLPLTLQPNTPPGQPDLKVTGIVWDQSRPKDGKNLKITVSVRNAGTRDATNVKVVLSLDGMEVGTYTMPLIRKGGGNASAYFNWTPTTGNHEVKVEAFVGTSALPDDVTTKFLKAYQSDEARFGSYLPLVLVIIMLLVIAIALLALTRKGGAGETPADEEEEDEEAGSEEE